jgi:cobalt/nickel transport system permease protein
LRFGLLCLGLPCEQGASLIVERREAPYVNARQKSGRSRIRTKEAIMHLGNAALTPECALAASAVAAGGLGFAAASLKHELPKRDEWLMAGAFGSAVFAAQMLNVPLLPHSSAHLVGGVLLAIVLRPALGALTMAAILAAQAILLGDGGLLSLGANVLNMALLPAAIVALGNAWRSMPDHRLSAAAIGGIQAALAVVLAAGLIVVEVGVAHDDVATFARAMLGSHMLVGALEGLVTAGVLYALRREAKWNTIFASAATLAVLAALPLASQMPDSYEAAALVSRWPQVLASTPYDVELANTWSVALFVGATAVVCCLMAFRPMPARVREKRL